MGQKNGAEIFVLYISTLYLIDIAEWMMYFIDIRKTCCDFVNSYVIAAIFWDAIIIIKIEELA